MSAVTFAIGDIHGCLDKLTRLVAVCEARAAGRPARFVFLGDYIDRGPDSRGVIDVLMRRQQAQPAAVVCLRGNHEQLAIDAHDDERAMPLWLQNSGGRTLRNYRVTNGRMSMRISNGCGRCRSATTTGCASSCMPALICPCRSTSRRTR